MEAQTSNTSTPTGKQFALLEKLHKQLGIEYTASEWANSTGYDVSKKITELIDKQKAVRAQKKTLPVQERLTKYLTQGQQIQLGMVKKEVARQSSAKYWAEHPHEFADACLGLFAAFNLADDVVAQNYCKQVEE